MDYLEELLREISLVKLAYNWSGINTPKINKFHTKSTAVVVPPIRAVCHTCTTAKPYC